MEPSQTGYQKPLRIAVIITTLFFLFELAGGFFSGSLALVSDAGHMFSDVLALILSLGAMTLATRLPTKGGHRVPPCRNLCAFTNSPFLSQ
jgi:cobalt-zinc-cadmium efflux system protein